MGGEGEGECIGMNEGVEGMYGEAEGGYIANGGVGGGGGGGIKETNGIIGHCIIQEKERAKGKTREGPERRCFVEGKEKKQKRQSPFFHSLFLAEWAGSQYLSSEALDETDEMDFSGTYFLYCLGDFL